MIKNAARGKRRAWNWLFRESPGMYFLYYENITSCSSVDSRVATSLRGNVLISPREKLRVQKKNGKPAKLREDMRSKLYASCAYGAFENLDSVIFDYYTFD